MTEDQKQRSLEDRWLELASGLTRSSPSEIETLRFVFYAGAAAAWNMAGDGQQLERDVLSFVEMERRREQHAEKSHGR